MNAYRAALAWARTVLASTLLVAASTGLWAQREPCVTQCEAKGMWSDDVSVTLDKGLNNIGSLHMTEEITRLSNTTGMPLRHLWTLYRVGGPDFDGAFARLEPNHKRVIYYGNAFDRRFSGRDGADLWYARVVLLHEMAHHLMEHTFHAGLLGKEELEADRFAGCMMAALLRRGDSSATETDVTKIYAQHAPTEAIGSHPGRDARIERVREGWGHGSPTPAANPRSTSACFKMMPLR